MMFRTNKYVQLEDTHEFVVLSLPVHLLIADRAFVEGFCDQR